MLFIEPVQLEYEEKYTYPGPVPMHETGLVFLAFLSADLYKTFLTPLG